MKRGGGRRPGRGSSGKRRAGGSGRGRRPAPGGGGSGGGGGGQRAGDGGRRNRPAGAASAAGDRDDAFSRQARAEGYPARSVYKLQDLDQRFRLLTRAANVLDLGAAPGSWTIYALQRIGPGGSVTAVDLAPLPPALAALDDQRLRYLQQDLTDHELHHRLGEHRFELVLSDAAPATSGNHSLDAARSAELVEAVLELALAILPPGGNMVAKLLQGQELPYLLARARRHFASARTAKPRASRAASTETFLLALDRS